MMTDTVAGVGRFAEAYNLVKQEAEKHEVLDHGPPIVRVQEVLDNITYAIASTRWDWANCPERKLQRKRLRAFIQTLRDVLRSAAGGLADLADTIADLEEEES